MIASRQTAIESEDFTLDTSDALLDTFLGAPKSATPEDSIKVNHPEISAGVPTAFVPDEVAATTATMTTLDEMSFDMLMPREDEEEEESCKPRIEPITGWIMFAFRI